MVDSMRIFAELWQRDASGAWPGEPETAEGDGQVTLSSFNLTLSLADIYAGTHLASS